MRRTETLIEILRKRGRKQQPLERLYRLLHTPDLLLVAYGNVARNKGATTVGVSAEDIIDGMNVDRINKLINQLHDGSFRWKPTKRTYIDKVNGGKRPLGNPSFTDKVLQEAMRILLEAYYEPRFSDHSHGFRPQRSCHTALREVQHTYRGTKWWVEGDIQGCFDNIDHTILLSILERDIKDRRFIKLVKQMLQAGYMEQWQYHHTYSGTPQGGILSPLLTNIYLHQFDCFMETLCEQYRTPNKTRKVNPEYNRHSRLIAAARKRGDKAEAARLAQAKRKLPVRNMMDHYVRIRYTRYADDFVVGVIGTKSIATDIKTRIKIFLQERLHLTLSDQKTLITHHSRKAHFLGFALTVCSDQQFAVKNKNGRICRTRMGCIGLEVPRDVTVKWRRKYCRNGKPTARYFLIDHSIHDIITTYGVELRGLYNYYAPAHNVAARLHPLRWIMNQSLCKTLAAKLKKSVSQVAKQFRYEGQIIGLGHITQREGKRPLTATFGTHNLRRQPFSSKIDVDQRRRRWISRTQLVDRLLADQCEICGVRGKCHVHHIRALRDVKGSKAGWQQLMSALRRKTLVVCPPCHQKIHRGQYDGVKLSKSTYSEEPRCGESSHVRFGGGRLEKQVKLLAGRLPDM